MRARDALKKHDPTTSPFDDVDDTHFGLTPGEDTYHSPEPRRASSSPQGSAYLRGFAADLRAKNK